MSAGHLQLGRLFREAAAAALEPGGRAGPHCNEVPEGGPNDDQRRSHRPGVPPVRRRGMVAWHRHGGETPGAVPERLRPAR